MKQKIVMHKNKPNKNLPKSLQDTKDHNFTVYYCLKDEHKDLNVKPLIMFAKSKDKRIRNVEIKEITDITKKDYKHQAFCILMNCDSNQYLIFKHHFEVGLKKYMLGTLEATQKDVEKYTL